MISCISNLAWSHYEEKKVINILKKYRIKKLEFSPNLLLKNNFNPKNVKKIKKKWKKYGFKLYSMQSVLFGIDNAYVFGNKYQNLVFLKEVRKKIKLAKALGAKVIVFGSPKNRKTFKKKNNYLNSTFVKTFKKISADCKRNKVNLCLEPNPKIYKSEYMVNTREASEIAKKIDNPFIKINLDLGAMIFNKENIEKVIKNNMNLIGHAQVSAPKLLSLSNYEKQVEVFINSLKKCKYKKTISLELLGNKKNNLKNLEKNLKIDRKSVV